VKNWKKTPPLTYFSWSRLLVSPTPPSFYNFLFKTILGPRTHLFFLPCILKLSVTQKHNQTPTLSSLNELHPLFLVGTIAMEDLCSHQSIEEPTHQGNRFSILASLSHANSINPKPYLPL
jgi:hypothetical protein